MSDPVTAVEAHQYAVALIAAAQSLDPNLFDAVLADVPPESAAVVLAVVAGIAAGYEVALSGAIGGPVLPAVALAMDDHD